MVMIGTSSPVKTSFGPEEGAIDTTLGR